MCGRYLHVSGKWVCIHGHINKNHGLDEKSMHMYAYGISKEKPKYIRGIK